MGQKILVVEDNELNLKLFCDLLRAHGFDAEPVRDGREAVERARAFGPDLVVMDIQMPYVSGLELIELMKADDDLKRTPIMAVTAYAAKGDEERIRDAGAEGYVSKPISVVKFVQAVEGLLEAARTAAEADAAADAPPDEASGAQTAADAAALAASADGEQVAVEVLDSAFCEEGNAQDCDGASPSSGEPEELTDSSEAPLAEAEAEPAGASAEEAAGRTADRSGDEAVEPDDPAKPG